MPVTGAVIREALAAVGAVGKQMRSFDELAAGANDALLQAPPGLTAAGAASWLADKAQESDYFRVTEEYAKTGRYAPYIGRTFQMITWKTNYAKFGAWCKARGIIRNDPNQFVADPPWLADYRWAWTGGVWYFEVNDLWRYANAGNHWAVSQGVNGGVGRIGSSFTPNGWSARITMFDAFRAAGDALLPTGTPPPAAPAGAGSVTGLRLDEGDVGPAVHALASWFNRWYPLYSSIDIDPNPALQRYGPQTRAVVREFAHRSGIPSADGRNVGPKIAAALDRAGFRL